MLDIKVNKNIDVNKMVARVNSAKQKAIFSTAVQFARVADPYVRYQTGQLAKSVQRSDFAHGKITYDTPYARHAYYGDTTVSHIRTGLECKRWGEVAWNAKGQQLTQHFNKVLKENM